MVQSPRMLTAAQDDGVVLTDEVKSRNNIDTTPHPTFSDKSSKPTFPNREGYLQGKAIVGQSAKFFCFGEYFYLLWQE